MYITHNKKKKKGTSIMNIIRETHIIIYHRKTFSPHDAEGRKKNHTYNEYRFYKQTAQNLNIIRLTKIATTDAFFFFNKI